MYTMSDFLFVLFHIFDKRHFIYFPDQHHRLCHGATKYNEHAQNQTKGQHC